MPDRQGQHKHSPRTNQIIHHSEFEIHNSKLPAVLITGGSGYLGRHLTAKASGSFGVYTTYNSRSGQIRAGHSLPLDVTDRAAVLDLVTSLSPQAVVHTAAVNPGRGDTQTMMRVNAMGSRYIAEAAIAVGARLVHVSTDVVHDGKDAPYADEAPASPLNAYGRSKARAETNVAEIDPQAVIVRTSLIYGLKEMDRGTASFVKRLTQHKLLILFNDVIRQPIWVETLAEALLKLVSIDFGGTLNIVGRQALSRAEFGRRMLAYWQVDDYDLLVSGAAADISATIPLNLRLSIDKAEQLLQMTFPGIDQVLALSGQRPQTAAP